MFEPTKSTNSFSRNDYQTAFDTTVLYCNTTLFCTARACGQFTSSSGLKRPAVIQEPQGGKRKNRNMSATFMFAGAGLAAALGAAFFTTKDLSAELQAIANRPIFPTDGRRVELCASIAFDGLHPFENFELKEVTSRRH